MAKRYQIRVSKDGQFYYVQVGKNNEPLSASELYTRREDAVRGVYDANPEPRDVEIVHQYAEGEEGESA